MLHPTVCQTFYHPPGHSPHNNPSLPLSRLLQIHEKYTQHLHYLLSILSHETLSLISGQLITPTFNTATTCEQIPQYDWLRFKLFLHLSLPLLIFFTFTSTIAVILLSNGSKPGPKSSKSVQDVVIVESKLFQVIIHLTSHPQPGLQCKSPLWLSIQYKPNTWCIGPKDADEINLENPSCRIFPHYSPSGIEAWLLT